MKEASPVRMPIPASSATRRRAGATIPASGPAHHPTKLRPEGTSLAVVQSYCYCRSSQHV